MKVMDLLDKEIDIDVYDNVCEELGIAFCGPLHLTKAGGEEFADVLDFNIELYDDCVVVDVDGDDWKSKLRKAKKFFNAAAGYCSEYDYLKWFFE